MKKLLLTGVALMGTLFSVQAQEIFSVDFSDTAVLTDWLNIDGDGDGFLWSVDTEGFAELETNGFSGGVALSQSFDNDSGTALTPDNSLVTQAFDVPATGATVTFKIGGVDPDFSLEHYAVYVVLSSDITSETTVAEFVALLDGMEPIIEETLASEVAVDKAAGLGAYANQNVRIVFRHYDVTDQFIIVLDDVTVTQGVTGLNENLAGSFSVYPNPSNNVVNITNSDNILINGATVTDLNGRVVKTAKFEGVANAQINISDLATGIYMMGITSDKGNTTIKIMKN